MAGSDSACRTISTYPLPFHHIDLVHHNHLARASKHVAAEHGKMFGQTTSELVVQGIDIISFDVQPLSNETWGDAWKGFYLKES